MTDQPDRPPIPPGKHPRTPEEKARLEQANRDAAELLHSIRMHDPSGYRKDTIPGYPEHLIPQDLPDPP